MFLFFVEKKSDADGASADEDCGNPGKKLFMPFITSNFMFSYFRSDLVCMT